MKKSIANLTLIAFVLSIVGLGTTVYAGWGKGSGYSAPGWHHQGDWPVGQRASVLACAGLLHLFLPRGPLSIPWPSSAVWSSSPSFLSSLFSIHSHTTTTTTTMSMQQTFYL